MDLWLLDADKMVTKNCGGRRQDDHFVNARAKTGEFERLTVAFDQEHVLCRRNSQLSGFVFEYGPHEFVYLTKELLVFIVVSGSRVLEMRKPLD